MRRAFELDVLECAACGGRMRLIAALTTPEAIAAILKFLGLSTRPPPLAAARPGAEPPEQPQLEFFEDC